MNNRAEQLVTTADDAVYRGLRFESAAQDNYMNGDRPIIVGPDCHKLHEWLATDPYEYQSLLKDVFVREMIASTTMAVLDHADTITTVVGEDAGGRIPAMIIGKAVNMVRVQQQLKPAKRVFLSGKVNDDHNPKYSAQGPEDRAVLVTEYVSSGATANRCLAALRRVGYVDPAVATIDRNGGNRKWLHTDYVYMGDRHTYEIHTTGNALHGIPRELKGVEQLYGLAYAKTVHLHKYNRSKLSSMRVECSHFAEEIVGIWYALQQDAADEL